MSYYVTPNYGGRTLFGSYQARTESKLYKCQLLLTESRHDIRRMTIGLWVFGVSLQELEFLLLIQLPQGEALYLRRIVQGTHKLM